MMAYRKRMRISTPHIPYYMSDMASAMPGLLAGLHEDDVDRLYRSIVVRHHPELVAGVTQSAWHVMPVDVPVFDASKGWTERRPQPDAVRHGLVADAASLLHAPSPLVKATVAATTPEQSAIRRPAPAEVDVVPRPPLTPLEIDREETIPAPSTTISHFQPPGGNTAYLLTKDEAAGRQLIVGHERYQRSAIKRFERGHLAVYTQLSTV